VRQVNPDRRQRCELHLPVVRARVATRRVIGLVMAMVFAASMSSTASSSTPSLDDDRGHLSKVLEASKSDGTWSCIEGRDRGWGALAILFAEYANRLGSLSRRQHPGSLSRHDPRIFCWPST